LVVRSLSRARNRGAQEGHVPDPVDSSPQPLVSDEELQSITVGARTPHNAPVTLVEYDPAWPAMFEREAARIRAALGDLVARLEHTGSTSVPGLVAKPVIDITLIVPSSAEESAYAPQLEAAGYALWIREPDWEEHRLFKRPDAAVHLHVFSVGSPELERMVGFRDWLRAHAEDRELYERTKRDLAARTWRHVQHYADAKTAVVEEIMARAGLPPGTRLD
jgi:GrpB-like predicted nucleotidyltransferase (UPF0157 family)